MFRALFALLLTFQLALTPMAGAMQGGPHPPDTGLTNAIHGCSFLITETMGVVQFGIGDLGKRQGTWAGSWPHMILHGGLGCVALEVMNGNCASGFFAGVSQSVLAGSGPTDAQKLQLAPLVGSFAGFVFSGGDGTSVSFGGTIAQSGLANNYLTHADLENLQSDLAALERECASSGSSNCTAAAIEARKLEILRQYLLRSDENNRSLAACFTIECINGHLDVAVTEAEVFDVLGATGSNGTWIAAQLASWQQLPSGWGEGAIVPPRWAVVTATVNVNMVEAANSFKTQQCGGRWDAACLSRFQEVISDFNTGIETGESFQFLALMLLAGGYVAKPTMTAAAEVCAGSWVCTSMLLGKQVSEEALAEFAAGGFGAAGLTFVTNTDFVENFLRTANNNRLGITADDYFRYVQTRLGSSTTPLSPEAYRAARNRFADIMASGGPFEAAALQALGLSVQKKIAITSIAADGRTVTTIPDAATVTTIVECKNYCANQIRLTDQLEAQLIFSETQGLGYTLVMNALTVVHREILDRVNSVNDLAGNPIGSGLLRFDLTTGQFLR